MTRHRKHEMRFPSYCGRCSRTKGVGSVSLLKGSKKSAGLVPWTVSTI